MISPKKTSDNLYGLRRPPITTFVIIAINDIIMAPKLRSETKRNSSWGRLPVEVKHNIIEHAAALLAQDYVDLGQELADLELQERRFRAKLLILWSAFGADESVMPFNNVHHQWKKSVDDRRQEARRLCGLACAKYNKRADLEYMAAWTAECEAYSVIQGLQWAMDVELRKQTTKIEQLYADKRQKLQ